MSLRLALLVLVLLLAPRAGLAAECRPVADFGRYTVGEYPSDWKPKEDAAREIYRVLSQGAVRFIRATARSAGIQIGKELEWDLEASPVLAWKWRPQLFPHGADERDAARNDSVLGVYAVFPHSPVSVKTVKYVWSAKAPAATTLTASRGLTRMVVLRSGEKTSAAWTEESVNVAQDYRRLFGEAPGQPRGIAILTDADDTKGAAVGDYAEFRVCPAGDPPASDNGKPATSAEDGKAPAAPPAAAPVKPAKPAAGKRPDKAPAPVTPKRQGSVEERTPPVDRAPIRYSRPAAAVPAITPQPEPR